MFSLPVLWRVAPLSTACRSVAPRFRARKNGRMIDRPGLAGFLRVRRAALQPEDVGLPRGQRRRTGGLRREEVAALCHMSADYYSRLERERGPQPSPQMVAAIAQGLHLSVEERDHLFHLAGHRPPMRGPDREHISPGMMRIFDRLADTPAEIVTELGETLRQNRLGAALVGDLMRFDGPARSIGYRWFTDPRARKCTRPTTTTSTHVCTYPDYEEWLRYEARSRMRRRSRNGSQARARSSARSGHGTKWV